MSRLRRAWAAIRETIAAILGVALSRWDAWRNGPYTPPGGGAGA